MNLRDAKVGLRVALHPATSLWMRGVRWATVAKVGRKLVTIRGDHGGVWKVHPVNLEEA